MNFDFRKYHVRAINARDEAEKAAINQELKDLYDSLSETDKKVFNEELQKFLVSQYKAIGDEYESLKKGGAFN
ncbi:hypothetical protein P1X15_21980 [Runella sp. MFBS21]|uniref:hypothetical protein n=1 Tax=Runella sp. MFBS21 TaxID=3034018 RepID=UPI0023F97C6F|nr:hypothetical protein [Runella sp. MFBS21]MDF7820306.1 hypothetical protein [Runella sp. MFBS21]